MFNEDDPANDDLRVCNCCESRSAEIRGGADLIGTEFGSSVVVKLLSRGRREYWLVRCKACDRVRRLRSDAVRAGRQCVCQSQKRRNDANRSHGLAASSEYRIWRGMRSRCENPANKAYPRYGGRGIAVCPEWASFERFIADVGRRPSPRYTLDRIDNGCGYAPGNVRWATIREQQQNTRRNHMVTFRGETLCLTEWERRLGFGRGVLKRRLSSGWLTEEAFTTPAGARMGVHSHRRNMPGKQPPPASPVKPNPAESP